MRCLGSPIHQRKFIIYVLGKKKRAGKTGGKTGRREKRREKRRSSTVNIKWAAVNLALTAFGSTVKVRMTAVNLTLTVIWVHGQGEIDCSPPKLDRMDYAIK